MRGLTASLLPGFYATVTLPAKIGLLDSCRVLYTLLYVCFKKQIFTVPFTTNQRRLLITPSYICKYCVMTQERGPSITSLLIWYVCLCACLCVIVLMFQCFISFTFSLFIHTLNSCFLWFHPFADAYTSCVVDSRFIYSLLCACLEGLCKCNYYLDLYMLKK